jgi:CheY-like chemotaxis protein
MTERVFIKVVGFSDVERHALNTVFRLSEDRATAYSLWEPGAPEAPKLALLDAQAYESRLEAESPGSKRLHIVWVGARPPKNAWRSFERPIIWSEVVQAMDQLFAPAPLDFDLEFGGEEESSGPDTQPSQLDEPSRRALIATATLEERLYWRAKLALARITLADDAESAQRAMELIRAQVYDVALVAYDLPGADGWDFVKQLANVVPAIGHVIVVKSDASLLDVVRARSAGAQAFFRRPPDPTRLQERLDKLA